MSRQVCISMMAFVALSPFALIDAATGGELVPFKGTLEGSFTATADLPPENNRFLDATGHATQVGDFTYDFPHSVDRSVVPATGIGFSTFTAANGDQVFAFVSGEATLFTPGVLLGVEQGTILGGTGRFANASGTFVIKRLIDTVNLTTIGAFDGAISAPSTP